ncbi:MAG: Cas9 endonuclease PAM-interacting domain-containing protein, partial [Clostridia bacterium]
LKENEYTKIANDIDQFIQNKDKNTEEYEKNKNNKTEILKWIKNEAAIYIYDVLTEKIKKEYFENVSKSLEDLRDNMLKLEIIDKIKLINLLLQLTSGISIDLRVIGGKSDQGRINSKNMNEKWLKGVVFVEQSVTGMYEKRFKLDELENCNNIKKM